MLMPNAVVGCSLECEFVNFAKSGALYEFLLGYSNTAGLNSLNSQGMRV